MEQQPTVSIKPFEELCAVKMIWQHDVKASDVRTAFKDISRQQPCPDEPYYVLVDIRSDPQFPLAETIVSALAGPFRDPQLVEWVIIGSNQTAKLIEHMLTRIAKRANVVWFDTPDEAEDYVRDALSQ